jgi:ABC-type uncharacterized transport system permease subunit
MLLAIDQLPHDSFTRAASLSFFVLIIAINILWFAIKIVLWTHGDRRWLFSHTHDMRGLKSLAAREEKAAMRLRYDMLRYAWNICFILLFVVPLTLLAISSLSQHAH